MGEVESKSASCGIGQFAQFGHFEYLAVVILHTGQQQQRNTLALLVKQCFEISHVKFIVVARFPLEQRVIRIKTV